MWTCKWLIFDDSCNEWPTFLYMFLGLHHHIPQELERQLADFDAQTNTAGALFQWFGIILCQEHVFEYFFGPNKVLPTAWLETRHTTKKYDFDCCYCMHVPKPIHSRPHSFKRPVWSSEAKSLEELLNDNSRPVVSWLLWLALTGLIYGVRHASFRIYKGSTWLPTPIQCWFVWHEFFYLLTSGME